MLSSRYLRFSRCMRHIEMLAHGDEEVPALAVVRVEVLGRGQTLSRSLLDGSHEVHAREGLREVDLHVLHLNIENAMRLARLHANLKVA